MAYYDLLSEPCYLRPKAVVGLHNSPGIILEAYFDSPYEMLSQKAKTLLN